jgi:hypothetical protein
MAGNALRLVISNIRIGRFRPISRDVLIDPAPGG